MNEGVLECLATVPSFIDRLDNSQQTSDLNVVEMLVLRTEEYIELLRVLTGRIEDVSRRLHFSQQLQDEHEQTLEDLHALSAILHEYLYYYLDYLMEIEDSSQNRVAIPQVIAMTGRPGRPVTVITKAQIETLIELGYTYARIARMFGMSERTLIRRRRELGLPVGLRKSNISDADLDGVIRTISQETANSGISMMRGALLSRGIIATREQVIRSMRRIDPLSQLIRRRVTTYRRQYNVPGPNSLWHIDGHHKLIRWKMVIHGGIDGFSRLVTFLRCSSNNRATTVLQLFCQAGMQFGYPSRVRCDYGVENVDVARWMISNMGLNRASIITGSSTHNQRVERLWRDVNRIVVRPYRNIFFYLENEGLLDPDNTSHLFCLHRVYLPLVNVTLTEFSEQYNHHPLRTERNETPYQLFIDGMLSRPQSCQRFLTDTVDPATYGVEEEGPSASPVETDGIVIVDPPSVQLTPAQETELQHQIDSVNVEDFGISKYLAALRQIDVWGL